MVKTRPGLSTSTHQRRTEIESGVETLVMGLLGSIDNGQYSHVGGLGVPYGTRQQWLLWDHHRHDSVVFRRQVRSALISDTCLEADSG